MAHPQSSPRGLFYKGTIRAQTTLEVGSNQQITDNGTNLSFNNGIVISGSQGLTGNSTGLTFVNPASALPGNVDNGVLIGVASDSTGVFAFINQTGTTHVYFNTTSVRPS